MALSILCSDITQVQADALVNAANSGLQQGSGVGGALFRAAGVRQLQDACAAIGYCPPGQVVLTPGFDIGIALEECSQFLQEHEISIILAVYDQEMLRLVEELRKKAD